MIPVIINNRNLLTWPKAMVKHIKKLKNVGEIIIVDNGSTYEPLLSWYKTLPYKIIYTTNLGSAAPWIVNAIPSIPYVVTDPDLGIDNIPLDTLIVLEKKINKNPSLGKIGLGLDWQCVRPSSPYYKFLRTHEGKRWGKSRVIDGVYVDVTVDTTFALYNRPDFFFGGGSVPSPYTARHIPWELSLAEVTKNREFSNYLKSVNRSCSYKRFLNLS